MAKEIDELTGAAELSDLQELRRVLLERGPRLYPEMPKKLPRARQAREDEVSSWQQECFDIAYLIARFSNFVEMLEARRDESK